MNGPSSDNLSLSFLSSTSPSASPTTTGRLCRRLSCWLSLCSSWWSRCIVSHARGRPHGFPCHVLPAEKADGDHNQPARSTTKSPHKPTKGHQDAIFPEQSIYGMQDAGILLLLLPCLVSDDVDDVFGGRGADVQCDDPQRGLRSRYRGGNGLSWKVKVPESRQIGRPCGTEDVFLFTV